jgi:hypothetical protein
MEPESCPVCGHLVGDAQVAARWHQHNGDPQPLPEGGANDVPPVPGRE